MKTFEAVIGLEVHAQLKTESKIFSASATTALQEANSQTDPVTLGMPGSLPVLNKRVVDLAIKLGLATQCKIRSESIFERKHYFYPDLPKGYQISQYAKPICEHGNLMIRTSAGEKKIGITRIHLEEDAGKNTHLDAEPYSVVDLNRAGVPLLEIVSEPELRSAEEAGAYVRTLRQLVRYLDVCDGNMEEGSLRCDANVSIRPVGQEAFGTKVEIKNLNSFRFVEKAIVYEIQRQQAVLEQGDEIVQETRLWDEQKGQTRSMRSKEYAEDYRYFPDPDLLPVVVDQRWIDRIEESIPELPANVFKRFCSDYELEQELAQQLSDEKIIATYFDQAVSEHQNAPAIANWIASELFGYLNRQSIAFEDCPVSPQNLAHLVRLIDENVISGKIAKSVFAEMCESGASPEHIVKEQGLKQITDSGQIEALINSILAANPEQVAEFRAGKEKVFGFFVGQIMKESQGKANPAIVNDLLRKKLAAS